MGRSGSVTVAEVQEHFGRFAAGHGHLGLYARISRGVAGDAQCAELLLHARPGQARPVLWLAALHDLVLRRPDVAAARWYPSVVGADAVPVGDPWPDVRDTVLAHADELREAIATRTTQTNEVGRSVYVTAGLARAAADLPGRPVVLVELGASAGLLLAVDRYRTELLVEGEEPVVLGDPDSTVVSRGRLVGRGRLGSPSTHPLPSVVGRSGLDLDPVDLDDDDRRRWLEACLWPDVPGRVERFRAAAEMVGAHPSPLLRGDLVDDVHRAVDLAAGRAVADAGGRPHVVVLTSWALTYVDNGRRVELARRLAQVARELGEVTWLSAEPPGCVPGLPSPTQSEAQAETVLAVRRWRAGRERDPELLGTAHPHGEWVSLRRAAPPPAPPPPTTPRTG